MDPETSADCESRLGRDFESFLPVYDLTTSQSCYGRILHPSTHQAFPTCGHLLRAFFPSSLIFDFYRSNCGVRVTVCILGSVFKILSSIHAMDARIDETFTREGDGDIQWFDAQCLAVVGDLVVTSPNVDFIPYLTLGRSTLVQRADGRFGAQDFTVMPQKFSVKFPHCGLIPALPLDQSHRAAPLWLTPGRSQFVEIPGSAFEDVGNLAPGWVKAIEPLVEELVDGVKKWEQTHPRDYLLRGTLTNLKQALSRLKYNPYTRRDMVNDYAYFCRCAHDVHALLKYLVKYEDVMITGTEIAPALRGILGTWTDDPERVQFLVTTGIPVWFVRSKVDFTAAMASRCRPNVRKVTIMNRCPGWVMHKLMGGADGKALPTPVLYEGLGGDAMHIVSHRHQFISLHTTQALNDAPPEPD
ncbi:hypothetical protein PLICRDRAFT_178403, partial [Plicaturopsis crispa FD-325 SS-3]